MERRITLKATKTFGKEIKFGTFLTFDTNKNWWIDADGNLVCEKGSPFEKYHTEPYGLTIKNRTIKEPTLKEQYLLNQDVVRVVELRNGSLYVVLKDRLLSADGWTSTENYNDEMLKPKESSRSYDIIKVYESYVDDYTAWCFSSTHRDSLKLVWERKEKTPQQIKKEEIEAKMRKLADELKELEV